MRVLSFPVAALVVSLVLPACTEDHEVLGSRSAAGAGNGGTAGVPVSEAGGPTSASGSGTGGDLSAGGGNRGGAGSSAGASGSAGHASSGGASGAGAGAGGSSAGAGAGGSAGMSGSGASAGAPSACPAGCNTKMPFTCGTGEVGWTCLGKFDAQHFLNGGCSDTGTDIQRYCCPTDFDAGCKPSCADLTTLAECDARTDCHSVFVDPGTCGCGAPGCCAHFSRCAEGYSTDCSGSMISCTVQAPFCDTPSYVVSYVNGCYEGCVAPKHCSAQ